MGNFNSCSEGCCTLLGSHHHPSRKSLFVVVDLSSILSEKKLDSDRNVISYSTYSTTNQEDTSYVDSGISKDLYSEEGNGTSQDSSVGHLRGSETFLPNEMDYTPSSNHDTLNSRKISENNSSRDLHRLSYKEKINLKKKEARRIQKSKLALEAEALLQRAQNTKRRLSNENEPTNIPRRSLLFKQRSARTWWNSFKAKGDDKFHRSLLRKSHKKEATIHAVEGKIPQTVFLFHNEEPTSTQEKHTAKEKHVRWQ